MAFVEEIKKYDVAYYAGGKNATDRLSLNPLIHSFFSGFISHKFRLDGNKGGCYVKC
jgi:hypothetical protein